MVRVMPHSSQDSYIQCPTASLDTHIKVCLSLLWALELLQQCENFFGIIVLQFVGHLLGGSNVWLMSTSSKGIDATHLCTSPHSQSLPSGSFHKPLIIIHQRGDRMKTTITVN